MYVLNIRFLFCAKYSAMEERTTAPGPGELANEIALLHLNKQLKLKYVHRQSRVLYAGARKNPLYDGEEAKQGRMAHGPQMDDSHDELERLTEQLRQEAGLPTTMSIETQFRAVIGKVGSKLCMYGWCCWDHNSCGGIFGPSEGLSEGNFLHRLPLFPYDPMQLGQFAVCTSFLRKCEPSDQPTEIGRFLRPLDEYVRTGFKHHSCIKSALPILEDEIDEAAREFVHMNQNGGEPYALVIPKGVLMAVAIHHGMIKLHDNPKGPELAVHLKPPKGDNYARGRGGSLLPALVPESPRGRSSASSLSSSVPTEPILTRSGSTLKLPRKTSNTTLLPPIVLFSPPTTPEPPISPSLSVASPVLVSVKRVSSVSNRNSTKPV
jgi:hypothetical protein